MCVLTKHITQCTSNFPTETAIFCVYSLSSVFIISIASPGKIADCQNYANSAPSVPQERRGSVVFFIAWSYTCALICKHKHKSRFATFEINVKAKTLSVLGSVYVKSREDFKL